MALYDPSVSPPHLLRSIPIPGTTRAVFGSDGVAWVGSGTTVFAVATSTPLAITASLDLGSTIRDVVVVSPYLYAATSSGLVQVDLVDPSQPVVARTIPTSSGQAWSIARIGKTLYVADGDSTVDAISIDFPSIPQGIGTISTIPGAVAVATDGVSQLVASDGRRSRIFSGSGASMTLTGSLDTAGATSAYFSESGAVFVAGLDSTLRAFDLDDPSNPALLFEDRLPPTGGTSNRIEQIAGSGNRLWVAAGDIGLVAYDLDQFQSPFPLHGYATSNEASVVASPDRVWSTPSDGGVTEYALDSEGRLSETRSWLDGQQARVDDRLGGDLLVSSLVTVTSWDTSVATPAATSSATFTAIVAGAAFMPDGSGAWVLLQDGSVWKADFSTATATVSAVSIPDATPSFIVRGGNGIALIDLRGDGTTRVRYFANGDLESDTPTITDFDGLATSSVALAADGTGAAVTFRGLYLLDLGAGTATLANGVNPFPAISSTIAGSELVILRSNEIQIRGRANGALLSTVPVSEGGVEVATGGTTDDVAIVAGSSGLATLRLDATTSLPVIVPSTNANRYDSKIVSGGGRVGLFDGTSLDVFPVTPYGLGSPGRTIEMGAGVVDVAATSTKNCALYGSGLVRCFDLAGAVVSQHQISEGSDQSMLGIDSVAGAVWVSVSSGCTMGGCRNTVIVLDASSASLPETARFDGRILDVAVDGTKAYSVSDQPGEVRAWNVNDPAHPSMTASMSSEGTPVAIAIDSATGDVYALGSTVVAYSGTLTRLGPLLDPWTADPSGRLAYIDQKMRIVDGCAVITGRTFDSTFYDIRGPLNWFAETSTSSASPGKGLVIEGGHVHILSAEGLEIWSAGPALSRPRGVKR